VRQHGDELVDVLRSLLQILDVASLAEVLRHRGEAALAPVAVVERVQHRPRPEAIAVLLHPPALGLAAPGLPREGELLPGPARLQVLRDVEAREVLADDLAARIALDALRAGVPAGDDALGIEHVDGVVGHAFDQQAEALLALAQRLLVQPAVGEIARDLRETEQLAGLVAQRGDGDARPEARAVLAHAPALVLEAALGGRGLELVLRPAAVDRLAGVEGGEVPADDFLGGVALDALRALVPAHHPPLGVEEEDRIVLRLIDDVLVDARIDHRLGPVAVRPGVVDALGQGLEADGGLHRQRAGVRIGAPLPEYGAIPVALGRDELPAERQVDSVGRSQADRLCRNCSRPVTAGAACAGVTSS
jgi:hypothetical protein